MTPRERAKLYARIARRIGAHSASATHEGREAHWTACVRWGPAASFYTFDPVANPADERRVRECLRSKLINVAEQHSESGCVCTVSCYDWGTGVDPCRITALLLAIDALPEVPND